MQKEQWGRPTHDSVRPTLSPLLHSAIVHGVTPKARVKGTETSPAAPVIKSVLGFHSGERETSPTYWLGDSSCSPAGNSCQHTQYIYVYIYVLHVQFPEAGMHAGGKHSATIPAHSLAASVRMSLHAQGDPRAGGWKPIYTSGDLVWYRHPSGPWIAGRVAGSELHSQVPLYAVVTLDDGVRRLARETELKLRTSGRQFSPSGDVSSVACYLLLPCTVIHSSCNIYPVLLCISFPRTISSIRIHHSARYGQFQGWQVTSWQISCMRKHTLYKQKHLRVPFSCTPSPHSTTVFCRFDSQWQHCCYCSDRRRPDKRVCCRPSKYTLCTLLTLLLLRGTPEVSI